MATIDKGTAVPLGAAAAVVLAVGIFLWNALSWAEEKHAELEAETEQLEDEIDAEQAKVDLLQQIVIDQKELVKQAAQDAKANRETLIRIEAKLGD